MKDNEGRRRIAKATRLMSEVGFCQKRQPKYKVIYFTVYKVVLSAWTQLIYTFYDCFFFYHTSLKIPAFACRQARHSLDCACAFRLVR